MPVYIPYKETDGKTRDDILTLVRESKVFQLQDWCEEYLKANGCLPWDRSGFIHTHQSTIDNQHQYDPINHNENVSHYGYDIVSGDATQQMVKLNQNSDDNKSIFIRHFLQQPEEFDAFYDLLQMTVDCYGSLGASFIYELLVEADGASRLNCLKINDIPLVELISQSDIKVADKIFPVAAELPINPEDKQVTIFSLIVSKISELLTRVPLTTRLLANFNELTNANAFGQHDKAIAAIIEQLFKPHSEAMCDNEDDADSAALSQISFYLGLLMYFIHETTHNTTYHIQFRAIHTAKHKKYRVIDAFERFCAAQQESPYIKDYTLFPWEYFEQYIANKNATNLGLTPVITENTPVGADLKPRTLTLADQKQPIFLPPKHTKEYTDKKRTALLTAEPELAQNLQDYEANNTIKKGLFFMDFALKKTQDALRSIRRNIVIDYNVLDLTDYQQYWLLELFWGRFDITRDILSFLHCFVLHHKTMNTTTTLKYDIVDILPTNLNPILKLLNQVNIYTDKSISSPHLFNSFLYFFSTNIAYYNAVLQKQLDVFDPASPNNILMHKLKDEDYKKLPLFVHGFNIILMNAFCHVNKPCLEIPATIPTTKYAGDSEKGQQQQRTTPLEDDDSTCYHASKMRVEKIILSISMQALFGVYNQNKALFDKTLSDENGMVTIQTTERLTNDPKEVKIPEMDFTPKLPYFYQTMLLTNFLAPHTFYHQHVHWHIVPVIWKRNQEAILGKDLALFQNRFITKFLQRNDAFLYRNFYQSGKQDWALKWYQQHRSFQHFYQAVVVKVPAFAHDQRANVLTATELNMFPVLYTMYYDLQAQQLIQQRDLLFKTFLSTAFKYLFNVKTMFLNSLNLKTIYFTDKSTLLYQLVDSFTLWYVYLSGSTTNGVENDRAQQGEMDDEEYLVEQFRLRARRMPPHQQVPTNITSVTTDIDGEETDRQKVLRLAQPLPDVCYDLVFCNDPIDVWPVDAQEYKPLIIDSHIVVPPPPQPDEKKLNPSQPGYAPPKNKVPLILTHYRELFKIAEDLTAGGNYWQIRAACIPPFKGQSAADTWVYCLLDSGYKLMTTYFAESDKTTKKKPDTLHMKQYLHFLNYFLIDRLEILFRGQQKKFDVSTTAIRKITTNTVMAKVAADGMDDDKKQQVLQPHPFTDPEIKDGAFTATLVALCAEMAKYGLSQ